MSEIRHEPLISTLKNQTYLNLLPKPTGQVHDVSTRTENRSKSVTGLRSNEYRKSLSQYYLLESYTEGAKEEEYFQFLFNGTYSQFRRIHRVKMDRPSKRFDWS